MSTGTKLMLACYETTPSRKRILMEAASKALEAEALASMRSDPCRLLRHLAAQDEARNTKPVQR